VGLRAEGVAGGYGAAPVVEDIWLEAADGEVLAVVGPNGSGKTTLLRVLGGFLPPTAGRVTLGGADARALTARERARKVAVVPQAAAVGFAFTVREVVEMGRTPFLSGMGRLSREDRAAVDRAMAMAGVADLADELAAELSSGQGQLVAVARALAQESPVILLDEPTAHLDVSHQIEVMETVRRLAKDGGKACLAVLHDLNLAAAFADRVALISKGRLRACGAPAEVLTRAHVAATFGLDVLVRRHPVSGAAFVVPLAVAVDADPGGAGPSRLGRVHVVCGGGTGGALLAALARGGADVSVGVLNVLDSDFETAEGLGLRVVAEAPFSALTEAAAAEAGRLALDGDAVVLAPVPFGPSNLANLALVERAAEAGKPVILLEPPGAPARDFTGGEAGRRLDALRARVGPGRTCATVDAVVAALARAPAPA
jgi:iron complex transport system ATP-binding protein